MWVGETFSVDVSDHGAGVRVASDPDVSGPRVGDCRRVGDGLGVTRFDGTDRVTWFELR
jgi:hypothetical protein